MEYLFLILLSALAGGIWGSFLGVLAIRVPLGISFIRPRSRCDQCKNPLKIQDMIPLFSWCILRGKCRTCGFPILPEIPLAEFTMASFTVLVVLMPFSLLQKSALLLYFSFALPLTLIDIRHHRLPHLLTITAIITGLFLSSRNIGGQGLILSAAGAILGFLPVALVSIVYPKGIGMGDAFWLAAIGSFVGPESLPEVLLIASGSGIIFAISLFLFRRSTLKDSIFNTALPFGPFLSLGGLLALLDPASFHHLIALT